MASSGTVRFRGSVHNGGDISVKYGVLTTFPSAVWDPQYEWIPLLFAHGGEIAGTFGFGSRDDSWDRSTTDSTIFNNWKTIKQAVPNCTTRLGTNWDAYEAAEAAVAGGTGGFLLNL
jgi:hypothetical protein